MLSLTFSFCAHTLIFAFCYLLVKHQWRLLWEGMSTAPKRPHWSCQWRVAEILLAVLVRFCSHVRANAGVWTSLQPLHCLGATLKDLENYMCSQVAPRQLVNSTEKGCHTEKRDFREDMARSFELKAGRSHRSSQKKMSHCWPTSSISLGVTKRLLIPAHPMVGLSLCTTALLCWWKKSQG